MNPIITIGMPGMPPGIMPPGMMMPPQQPSILPIVAVVGLGVVAFMLLSRRSNPSRRRRRARRRR